MGLADLHHGRAFEASLVQAVKHGDSGVPVDASIGDGHTALEAGGALRRDILATSVDVGLDHHTGEGEIAGLELLADVVEDLGLVAVVLGGVAVRAVDHDGPGEAGLLDLIGGGLHKLSLEVRALGATLDTEHIRELSDVKGWR